MSAPKKIFISYRRVDAYAMAVRIQREFYRLAAPGSVEVFLDHLSVQSGDWASQIRSRLQEADALIAIIGPDWFGESADGSRRIDAPGDWVRTEIKEGLSRLGDLGRFFPVFVEGAKPFTAEQLPSEIAGLAAQQAKIIATEEEELRRDLEGLVYLVYRILKWPAPTPAPIKAADRVMLTPGTRTQIIESQDHRILVRFHVEGDAIKRQAFVGASAEGIPLQKIKKSSRKRLEPHELYEMLFGATEEEQQKLLRLVFPEAADNGRPIHPGRGSLRVVMSSNDSWILNQDWALATFSHAVHGACDLVERDWTFEWTKHQWDQPCAKAPSLEIDWPQPILVVTR